MDSKAFDRLVAAAAARPSRRGALRLLAGGILGGLVARGGAVGAAAQADTDGDGLFDWDEANVYGTDPYYWDTDGDGGGDGEEVYYGTSPLVGNGTLRAEDPVVINDFQPEPGGSISVGDIGVGTEGGVGIGSVCLAPGDVCSANADCCSASVLCCLNWATMQSYCTDVTHYGYVCP